MTIPNVHEMILDELAELKRMVRELKDAQLDKQVVDTEKYLTAEQTAEFFKCSRVYVYSALKKRIPYILRGARVYFALSDLHEYMESGKRFPKKK